MYGCRRYGWITRIIVRLENGECTVRKQKVEWENEYNNQKAEGRMGE
jgi:hypothetical protein